MESDSAHLQRLRKLFEEAPIRELDGLEWASCGDGVCEAGEDCNSCADDCEGRSNGVVRKQFCCGNGIPESAEGDGSRCQGSY